MKYVLYNHVGSGNHGCEALVRSIFKLFNNKEIVLLSEAPTEEQNYSINDLIEVRPALNNKIKWTKKAFAYWKLKVDHNYFYMDTLPYLDAISKLSKDDLLFSIGGDIYCYDNYPKYILLHKYAKKFVNKTVLLGCSIEPDLLNDIKLLNDLRAYDLITARESITYNSLKKAGLENVIYCPDTAFVLDKKEISLPTEFQIGNTIGLNISPLVLNKSTNADLILENYRVLIQHILDNTDKSVALIPHVKWKDNDDSIPLSLLYQEFGKDKRVILLPDMKAEEIKYCISCCKAFIGARTHATIAAYSTCVPTIVLGYSVKSRGIAKDLFGTTEHYVVSYDEILDNSVLLHEYLWLEKRHNAIENILKTKINEYSGQLEKMKSNTIFELT